MIDRAVLALEGGDGCGCAALKLVVIVGVEQIVFAVVLVLHDGFGLGQAGF